jgi:hypothetical protein
MCVGITLLLILLLVFYVDYQMASLVIGEQVGQQTIWLAQGWAVTESMWGLMLLSGLVGVLVVLLFLKLKKVI